MAGRRPAMTIFGEASPGIPTFVEEPLFLGPHLPPEDRIAMRKASEAANDVAVPPRGRGGRFRKRRRERDRTILVGQHFGVRERKIEEQPQARLDEPIVFQTQRGTRDR